jgi:polysaccharide export outer membrane protein
MISLFPARRLLLWSCIPLLVLLAVCARGSSGQGYALGPRDVVKITVWGQQDLSGEFAVGLDGTIRFPLVGPVVASGLTESQLAERLRVLLEKDYLVNPQVFVGVTEYKSKKVIVLGEVAKPGAYPLTGDVTLLEILSQAGISSSAGKEIVLVRVGQKVASAGETQTTGNTIKRLSVDKIRSVDPKDNILVEDGDTIFVPKANTFFVLGEVAKPGVYPLEKEMTVFEGLVVAGGFATKAAPAGTKVIRKLPDGTQDTLSVDLSGNIPADRQTKIVDGDTILVPRGNSFFIFGEVKKPGEYQLEKDTTILEAISAAGGFTDKAAPGRSKVIRATPKGQQTIEVDMNDIIKRGRRDKSIPLVENDVIVVPESFF